MKLLTITLDKMVCKRPKPRKGQPNVCAPTLDTRAILQPRQRWHVSIGLISSSGKKKPTQSAKSPGTKPDDGLWSGRTLG